MSGWTKEDLENMLEDVVNELNLSDSMLEKHGPLGTAPAELVREVIDRKNLEINMLRSGLTDASYAALISRAEAAESELARVKASGIESMRRVEAAEKERDAIRAERDRMRDALERIANRTKLFRCDCGWIGLEGDTIYETIIGEVSEDQSVWGCPKCGGDDSIGEMEPDDIARAALGGGEWKK